MLDPLGRIPTLTVTPLHAHDCAFGPGWFRVCWEDQRRFCQDWGEVQLLCKLLDGRVKEVQVQRDGCLDRVPDDAGTPDAVDAARWLAMDKVEAMRVLGLTREADYTRAYKDVEAMVHARDNRAIQTGVRATVIIKKPGAKVTDI
jgi:hypothetical protein